MTRPPLVLITGAARSGTSMVSGVLAACGLDFGGPLVDKRRKYQPRGFWEHRPVREKVLKPLLRKMGADPRGQDPLPVRGRQPSDREAARLAKRVGRKLGPARAYKDAKILLVWPWFNRAFPDATWILVRRDKKAIVRSCQRAPFMNRLTYVAGWLKWVEHHEACMDDLKASGANVIEVWPDAFDPDVFRPLVEALGLEWNEEAVRKALVPDAWHLK